MSLHHGGQVYAANSSSIPLGHLPRQCEHPQVEQMILVVQLWGAC